MNNNNYELIHDESHFFHSFSRTSFFERLANWSRFFCYGLILFHLGSILLQMLQPFATNPPDLFFQLLFFLLLWGSISLWQFDLKR
jgi:hypothetical protein